MDVGKEGLVQFRPYVLNLINDPDPDIRTEALKVMTFHWKEPEYEKVAFEAVLNDKDPRNRELALSYWSTYYKATADKATLTTLAKFVLNEKLPIKFRAVALRQFYRILYPMVYSGSFTEKLGDALYSARNKETFIALLPMNEISMYI